MFALKKLWHRSRRWVKRDWQAFTRTGRQNALLPLLVSLLALLAATTNWAAVGALIHPADHVLYQFPVIARPAPPTSTAAPGADCQHIACLALTFDDGPNPLTTPQILSTLEQFHVTATFFLVGSRVPGNEALLQRMRADGDEIGDHSWSHPDFTTLTPQQMKDQINATQRAIMAAGVPPPILFRPPYGAVNATVEANVPMTILLWNEDPQDWAATRASTVVQAVEASARPGGIVDMHDIYHVTADALPQILTDLQARGFQFVTVSQLLHLTPASRGLYYGHS
jgi:peptidoglycan/xylan/chitin deacetylase (PgdA/CDA1 family)